MALKTQGKNGPLVYKLVLTGGPCGGKTTGQARLSTFMESIGWRVYRVPETATILLSGGVKFDELTSEGAFEFQENLIKTMMQIERTYYDLARVSSKNCLLICDRGVKDATAYMEPSDWEVMKKKNGWDEVDLRDRSYQQIIHMVSAAVGAEDFYTCDHRCRSEDIVLARELDTRVAEAWVGHPYYDVIDNSTDFEQKCLRMIASVCLRLGIDFGDRLSSGSKKRKFLIRSMPADEKFPSPFQDFDVVHDYLVTPSSKTQARIRRRGQNDNWTYTHTIRRPEINHQTVELRMTIPNRDYEILLAQRDDHHYTIYKRRRCFLWNNVYMQMDEYQKPCSEVCEGLVLMETFTRKKGNELHLPDFLDVIREVTDNPKFSMFNMSMKKDIMPPVNTTTTDSTIDSSGDKEMNGKPDKMVSFALSEDIKSANAESAWNSDVGHT